MQANGCLLYAAVAAEDLRGVVVVVVVVVGRDLCVVLLVRPYAGFHVLDLYLVHARMQSCTVSTDYFCRCHIAIGCRVWF